MKIRIYKISFLSPPAGITVWHWKNWMITIRIPTGASSPGVGMVRESIVKHEIPMTYEYPCIPRLICGIMDSSWQSQ